MRKLLILIALTACGSEPAPSPADDYARAAVEIGTATCELIARCCDAGERAAVTSALGGADATSCAAGFEAATAPLEAGLRDGTLTLDRDALEACLDATRAGTCAALSAADTPCRRVLRGQLVDGVACTDDLPCASGYCAGPDASGDRTCARLPSVGEACGDRCAAGAWCRRVSGVGVCTTAAADGTACGVDEECASGACVGAAPLLERAGVCGAPAPWCDGT